MQVRWTDGLKAGEHADVDDDLARDFIASGKAVRVGGVDPETPERKPRTRKAAPGLETR